MSHSIHTLEAPLGVVVVDHLDGQPQHSPAIRHIVRYLLHCGVSPSDALAQASRWVQDAQAQLITDGRQADDAAVDRCARALMVDQLLAGKIASLATVACAVPAATPHPMNPADKPRPVGLLRRDWWAARLGRSSSLSSSNTVVGN